MSDLMSAEDVAARMNERVSPRMVRDRWRSKRWPFTEIGGFRGMTEAQYWEAIAIEAVAATNLPAAPSASGLSPRSRHRRAS